jgi:hypothetical protein
VLIVRPHEAHLSPAAFGGVAEAKKVRYENARNRRLGSWQLFLSRINFSGCLRMPGWICQLGFRCPWPPNLFAKTSIIRSIKNQVPRKATHSKVKLWNL